MSGRIFRKLFVWYPRFSKCHSVPRLSFFFFLITCLFPNEAHGSEIYSLLIQPDYNTPVWNLPLKLHSKSQFMIGIFYKLLRIGTYFSLRILIPPSLIHRQRRTQFSWSYQKAPPTLPPTLPAGPVPCPRGEKSHPPRVLCQALLFLFQWHWNLLMFCSWPPGLGSLYYGPAI